MLLPLLLLLPTVLLVSIAYILYIHISIYCQEACSVIDENVASFWRNLSFSACARFEEYFKHKCEVQVFVLIFGTLILCLSLRSLLLRMVICLKQQLDGTPTPEVYLVALALLT